jgi:hypothetical protein
MEVTMATNRAFTFQDFLDGRCKAEEIGTFVPDSFVESAFEKGESHKIPVTESIVEPLSAADRKILIQRIHDAALRAISENVEGYISDSASTVNKVLESAIKILEREEQTEDAVGRMTEQELENFSTNDLRRFMISMFTKEDLTPDQRVALIRELASERCQSCGERPFP